MRRDADTKHMRATLLTATAIVTMLSTTSCAPHAMTSGEAQTEIQQAYAHQDAGFAAKNLNDMFYHVQGTAKLTGTDGHTRSAGKAQSDMQGIIVHGGSLTSQTRITKFSLDGKTATVMVAVHQTYTLVNTTSNTEQGITEPFDSTLTGQDTWTLTDDGWWQTAGKTLTDHELRNGAPYDSN